MLSYNYFCALVFWNTCDLARPRAWLFSQSYYYFLSNYHLRFQTIYIFSDRYWTYCKLLVVSWLVMFKYWSGWSDDGLTSFCRLPDCLIVDHLNCWPNYTVSCVNNFLKYIINNKWAIILTYTSINQIQIHKVVNTS